MSRQGWRSAVPAELGTSHVRVRSAAGEWLVKRGYEKEVERGNLDFLLRGNSDEPPASGRGRGPISRVFLGGAHAVGKQARHGGLLAPILGRLYLGDRRGVEQIGAALRLRGAGVPTPEILALGTARVFGPLRSHAIVSRELRGARNLLELARDAPPSDVRRGVLDRCADLIRKMHDSGFVHADLNVSNLVLEHGAAGDVLYIVDLDRGRFRETLTLRARERSLARLLRSYEKWIGDRLRLSPREEIRFLRRYAGPDRADVRTLAKCLARARSRFRLRRWSLRPVASSTGRFAGPLQ